MVDMRHLQKVNDWEPNQISGYEVSINNFDDLESIADSIFFIAGNNFLQGGSSLKIMNIKERYPQIFDWLNLQDMNVWVILALMLAVAGFNMISGLLILILEKTNLIGLLKALGYSNWHIQKIFIIQSFFLIAFAGLMCDTSNDGNNMTSSVETSVPTLSATTCSHFRLIGTELM